MNIRIWLTGLTALTLAGGLSEVCAQTVASTTDIEWRARWIGTGAARQENTWTVFRKSFSLGQRPQSAIARIAVDSKYWLWVNGAQVVFEGGLKRGPNPKDSYFDEVELAPWLRSGTNTIAVLAWYWGREGFSHKDSGKGGFLFDLESGETRIASDGSWRAMLHPSYSTPTGEKPNFRLPESNIRFDARLEPDRWTEAAFDDSKWSNAVVFGNAGAAPWNRLHKRPIPQWKDFGLKDYARVSFPVVSTGQVFAVNLPYNCQFTPWLQVESPAGLTIDLRTSNHRGGGEQNVRGEYVTRDGIQEYESLGWMNGEQMLYTIPAGVKVLGLKFRETGFDTEFSGTFSCEDPFLNRLWEKSRRTLYVTMRDNYMDCPDRERAQWWGDAVIELGEAFYALSPSSAQLARKAIYDLCGWQRPNKTLYSPIPSMAWNSELPQQMLASVGQYGFWTYYFYSGDKQTAVDSYPHVRDYLSLWKTDAEGLVVHRNGEWNWADWGRNIDERVLDQAWYCLALQGAANLARLAGEAKEAEQYEAIRARVISAANRLHWNGSAYRSPGYTGATDDRANAMCVIAGIARPEQYQGIQEVLAKERHASPYMEKYVLEALVLMGNPNGAVARMKERYAKMVEDSGTTLSELWNPGDPLVGAGDLVSTRNHAWSGGPLTILSQYIAGIAPTAPAWKTYHVRPQPGSLTNISATVDSVAGRIAVALNRSPTSVSMQLESPEGTTAQVSLPSGSAAPEALYVNQRLLWRAGESAGKLNGIVFKTAGKDSVQLEVSPGTWQFELRLSDQK